MGCCEVLCKALCGYSCAVFLACAVFCACEDDGRAVAVFTGVEPVYQLGVCDNRVQALTLYLTEPDTLSLGIDGGTGIYRLANLNDSVATAQFAEDINGYQRIRLLPRAEGETVLRVADSDNDYTELTIVVRRRLEYKLVKIETSYGITAGYTQWLDPLAEADADHVLVESGGYILLVPDSMVESARGVLEVYPTADTMEPLVGRYSVSHNEGEGVGKVWTFIIEGVERVFHQTPYGPTSAELVLAEDITALCGAGLLPGGVVAIRRELFCTED